jgi:hypothetical protein
LSVGCLHTEDTVGDSVALDLCGRCLAGEMVRFVLEGLPERTHMDWYCDDRELREHWDGFVSGSVALDPATVVGVDAD